MKKEYLIDEMTVEDYKEILEFVITLSVDAEGYALDGNYEYDEIEKCIIIREMIEVLNDVPRRRADWILNEKWREWEERRKRLGLD